MVKVTGLTPNNVDALRKAFPSVIAEGEMEVTATTVTFKSLDAHEAWDEVTTAAQMLGTRNHPGKSLLAVARKLKTKFKEEA